MPQASLLSYFTKPLTTVAAVPPSPGRDGHAKYEDLSSSVLSTRTQSILETRKQASQSFTLPTDDASRVQNQRAQCATRTRELEGSNRPPEATSNSGPKPVTTISISHLPAASISLVSEQHLQAIRRLTATTLPVRYSDAFFKTTLTDPIAQQLSRVIIYESEPVGWIRCRLEPCSLNSSLGSKTSPPLSQIYIQALALLSPYRSLGLATILLNAILSSAESLSEDPVCIYAHVWEKNEDALDWYAKRGFKRVMLVERYYTRLRPGGAWLVRRELHDT